MKGRCLGWFPGDLWPMVPVTVEILMNEFGRYPWNLKLADAQAIVHSIEQVSIVDFVLEYANTVLGGSGVEALEAHEVHGNFIDYYDIRLLYVDQGDKYATTLAYDTKYGKFGVTSWGDWLDWAEATGEMPQKRPKRGDYSDTWTPERRMRRTRGKLPG